MGLLGRWRFGIVRRLRVRNGALRRLMRQFASAPGSGPCTVGARGGNGNTPQNSRCGASIELMLADRVLPSAIGERLSRSVARCASARAYADRDET